MNIDQFRTLDAIIRTGSFRAAAQDLNKVQSAVSYSIKTLEQELGLSVFSREGYKPTLTNAGKALLQKARVLLADMEDLELLSEHLAQGHEPQLRISISPVAPMPLLLPAFKAISDKFPTTRFQITSEALGGEELVLSGQVDMALTHVLQSYEELVVKSWLSVSMRAVASKNHPLTLLPTITRQDMLKHFQIIVSSGSSAGQGSTRGVFRGSSVWTVPHFAVKKDLILAGMGWGNLPGHLVEDDLEKGRLIELNLPGLKSVEATMALVRKAGDHGGPVARELWLELVKCLPSGGVFQS